MTSTQIKIGLIVFLVLMVSAYVLSFNGRKSGLCGMLWAIGTLVAAVLVFMIPV
jgi:steroid 5-alpha reductase family enzyme